MNRKRILALTMALTLLIVVLPCSVHASGTGLSRYMYVVTGNGGSLNVRSDMTTGNNIIYKLPYGTAVLVDGFYNNDTWAKIQFTVGYSSFHGFVMSKYLSYNNPRIVNTPTPVPQPTAIPVPAEDPEPLDFSQFHHVDPYLVYANPSRASGWVNLRWAPSTAVDVIERCYQYYQLVVLAEDSVWAQAYDPQTGVVGFIMKQYLRDMGYGSSVHLVLK